ASAPRRAEDQRSSSSFSPAATLVASSRRPVNRTSAVRRSDGLSPRSRPESNGMLSWRGALGSSAGVGRLLILLPWTMIGSSRELRLKPHLDQQVMQLNQRRYRDARRAEPHSGAGGGIEHPCRHHDDYTG